MMKFKQCCAVLAGALLAVQAAAQAPVALPPPVSWAQVQALPAPANGELLAYGTAPDQLGELMLPRGEGPFPVAVLIHGGCWLQAFNVGYFRPLAAALSKAGVATWNMEYRRVGGAGGWPQTFEDIADGIDQLRVLAQDHPLDLERVNVVGHSAGGHLALWAATRAALEPDSALYRAQPLPLRGVVGLAAIANLATYRIGPPGSCHSAVDGLMGGSPEDQARRYADASPSQRLPIALPVTLISGEADGIVPLAGVRQFAALEGAGSPVRVIAIPEAGHFDVAVPGSVSWPVVRGAVLQQLKDSGD